MTDAPLSNEAARAAAVQDFTDRGLSLAAKAQIVLICHEQILAGADLKQVADTLMGGALDLMNTRDGVLGVKVYCEGIVEQIDRALALADAAQAGEAPDPARAH